MFVSDVINEIRAWILMKLNEALILLGCILVAGQSVPASAMMPRSATWQKDGEDFRKFRAPGHWVPTFGASPQSSSQSVPVNINVTPPSRGEWNGFWGFDEPAKRAVPPSQSPLPRSASSVPA